MCGADLKDMDLKKTEDLIIKRGKDDCESSIRNIENRRFSNANLKIGDF
jgi:hypothetical protein